MAKLVYVVHWLVVKMNQFVLICDGRIIGIENSDYVPRVGELVLLNRVSYTVWNVAHDFDNNRLTVLLNEVKL